MPLAWAHSELIKLAVAASTGRPVEMLTLVSDRYQHAAVPTSATWFWRDTTPVRALPAGRTLVVAGTGQFTLHYGFDEWNPATIAERAAQPLGLGLFGVTLTPADLAGHVSLQFVRRYPDGSWEPATRNDVALAAPALAAVHLSPAHLGAIPPPARHRRIVKFNDEQRVCVPRIPSALTCRVPNSAAWLDLGIYATRWYSLRRPPRAGRRLIRAWQRSATGWSGRAGGRRSRPRWGRRPL